MFSITRAKRIAAAYDDMQHTPLRPDVAAAYEAFKCEVYHQYRELAGPIIDVLHVPYNPYDSSRELFADIRDNQCLAVYQGGDLPSDHPLRELAPRCRRLSYNDLFRAVHDYYGHYIPCAGFGPKGEDAAWYNHSRMFSPLAQRAMTTETRGQNSWFVEHNKPGQEPKVYAPQKTGILPDFAFDTD